MSNFSFNNAMDYLDSLAHFMPSKVVSGEYEMGLGAISELLNLSGNPENSLKIIHVAGTNGKGSTIAFLSEILSAANLRVGVFTSPALLRVNEQIRINDTEISDDDFAYEICSLIPHIDHMKNQNHKITTEFETITVAALNYFVRNNCDIVILECGLGGRNDATNVIPTPLLSVITSIGLDHTEILGDTIEKIAYQKSGIIKKNGTAVVIEDENTIDIFREESAKVKARLITAKLNATIDNYELGLKGEYQKINANLARTCAVVLRDFGYVITDENIKTGLRDAHINCRFEIVSYNPTFIIDGSHNLHGVTALANSLKQMWPNKKFHFITGVLKDKAFDKMMEIFTPIADTFYTVNVPSPRALSSQELCDYLRSRGCNAINCNSYEEALLRVKNNTQIDDVIVAFGSLYYVGGLRQFLLDFSKDA